MAGSMRASLREKAAYADLIVQAVKLVGKGRQEDLARAMGVRQQIVSKLIYGDTPLTPDLAIAIHRATGGAVPASDLRPDLWASPEHVPLAPVSHETVGAPA